MTGNGCTPPTNYANLFVNVLSQTQAAVDNKVDAAFAQLFHDPANQNNVGCRSRPTCLITREM
jgi:hypothetical protein